MAFTYANIDMAAFLADNRLRLQQKVDYIEGYTVTLIVGFVWMQKRKLMSQSTKISRLYSSVRKYAECMTRTPVLSTIICNRTKSTYFSTFLPQKSNLPTKNSTLFGNFARR